MPQKSVSLAIGLVWLAQPQARADLFLVGAVGYADTAIAPGWNLISNPLISGDNSIATLFHGAPVGTSVFVYTPGQGFSVATKEEDSGVFVPSDVAAQTVLPGGGVFVLAPSPFVVTFVGEVSQGELKNPLPKGFSIKSSMVPQSGTAEELGLPANPGDTLFQFDVATQSYVVSSFDEFDMAWSPPLRRLKVGEAFFLLRTEEGSWDRTFLLNQ